VQSATAELRTQLLAKAGKNETKMMIPMVFVILPVTVMFALYPSLALIQGSFL
jgi:tight adherence protein C